MPIGPPAVQANPKFVKQPARTEMIETELILRSGELREAALAALGVPIVHCGAEMRARDEHEARAVSALRAGARANGVEVRESAGGTLEVPGEAITDPAAYTLALAH